MSFCAAIFCPYRHSLYKREWSEENEIIAPSQQARMLASMRAKVARQHEAAARAHATAVAQQVVAAQQSTIIVQWSRQKNVPRGGDDDVAARARRAFHGCLSELAPQSVLCVTHGDLFNSYMPELFPGAGFSGYKAEVAGFAVVRGPSAGREQADADSIGAMHRITLM
jgi:hypothetical protein